MAGAWTKVLAAMAAATALVAPLALWAAPANAALYWSDGAGGQLRGVNLDGSAEQLVNGGSQLPPGVPLPEPGSQYSCGEGIAVHGSFAYWREYGLGTIARANLASGEENRTFITGLQDPCGVAVDDAHIYWVDKYSGTIGRANLGGSEVEREFVSGLGEPCGIAVEAGELYWTAQPGVYEWESYIGRMPSGGGIVERIFEGSEETPYEDFPSCAIAVDASHAYFDVNSSIGRINLDGSNPDLEFLPGDIACGITVENQRIYWSGVSPSGDRAVMSADLSGGPLAPVPVIVDPFGYYPCALAADDAVLAPPHRFFEEPAKPKQQPPPSPAPAPLVLDFGGSRHASRGYATFVSIHLGQSGTLFPTARTTTGQPLRVGVASGKTTEVQGVESRVLKVSLPKGSAARPLLARLRRQGKVRFEVTVQFVGPEGSIETIHRFLYFVAPRARHSARRPGA
jgi:hypothetical protein